MCVSKDTRSKLSRFWKQSFAVFALNLGQLSIGLGLGYSSVLIPQLKRDQSKIPVGVTEISWVVSLVSIGQMGGAIIGAWLGSAVGRKGTVLLSAVPTVTGWCVIAIAQNIPMLYAGRILCGLGMGIEGTIHPVYVCELTSPSLRGPLAASGVIVITAGILLSYVLGTFIEWKLIAWIYLSVPVLMCIFVFLIPESPIWLVRKRQYNRADKALAWLQQEEDEFAREVEFEFQNRIIKVTENQNGGQNVEFGFCDLCCSKLTVYLSRIFSKKVLLPFFIVVSLFFFQNWSGFIVTIFYTVVIFEDAAIELDEFHATILVGSVQVIGATIGSVVVNIAGRRSLLIASTGLCSLCMGLLGTVFFLKTHEPESVIIQAAGSWLPLACLLVFTFVFTVGLGPVPWVFLGELFPADVRSYAAGCATCCCFAFIFLANFSYPYLILEIQNYGVFWLYSAISALGLLFCIFLVPETKNRTLEEIENHFTQSDGIMSLFTTIPPSLPPRDAAEFDKVPDQEGNM